VEHKINQHRILKSGQTEQNHWSIESHRTKHFNPDNETKSVEHKIKQHKTLQSAQTKQTSGA
jgi:hypothetical protein